MKGLLYVLLQCTWGLLQTAAGVAVLLWYRKCPHSRYHSAVVTVYPLYSSLSLGPFIFLSDKPPRDRRGLVPHGEISRRLLGPLYLPAVGLPSALWAHLPTCQRKWRGEVSYFSFFTEKTANSLGELAVKEPSMRGIVI